MKTDFLLQEYEEMFAEKRHYDTRFSTLVSFYFSILTVTVSAISIISALSNLQIELFEMAISFVISIVGLMVLLSLYYNRVNYVKVCRQINAIRAFCLDNDIPTFKESNHMYTNDAYPKYYMRNSIQFLFFYFFAICNGFFFSFFLVKLLSFIKLVSFNYIYVIILTVGLFILQSLIIRISTKKRDKEGKKVAKF